MNQEDWEKENREQSFKLEDGSNFLGSERLPARIVVKIKFDKDDNQTNKRTFSRASQKGIKH
jgi:hypothetical protein